MRRRRLERRMPRRRLHQVLRNQTEGPTRKHVCLQTNGKRLCSILPQASCLLRHLSRIRKARTKSCCERPLHSKQRARGWTYIGWGSHVARAGICLVDLRLQPPNHLKLLAYLRMPHNVHVCTLRIYLCFRPNPDVSSSTDERARHAHADALAYTPLAAAPEAPRPSPARSWPLLRTSKCILSPGQPFSFPLER